MVIRLWHVAPLEGPSGISGARVIIAISTVTILCDGDTWVCPCLAVVQDHGKETIMLVTTWEYSDGPLNEPIELVTSANRPATFERDLIAQHWQHAADGPNGSRIYMRADATVAYEVHC